MQPREKKLLMVVGGVGVCMAALFAMQSLGGGGPGKPDDVEVARQKLDAAQKRIVEGKQVQSQLTNLKSRSLPSDKAIAGSVYHSWLRELMDRTHLMSGADIQAPTPTKTPSNFTRYSYLITANGSLEQITQFLVAFYAADHLHKITNLHLKPVEAGKQMSMRVTIEALGLDDATSKSELTKGTYSRLPEKDLLASKKAIMDRNLFAKYVAPTPPPPKKEVKVTPPAPPKEVVVTPPPPLEFDHAKYAKVTSLFQTSAGSEAFLGVQTKGETLKLKAGDEFKIGTVKGTVTRITQQGIEFSTDGRVKMVGLGKALTEATIIEEVRIDEPTIE